MCGRITGFNKLYIYLESGAGSGGEEEKDTRVWEDNWDDDAVEDDFSNQLR